MFKTILVGCRYEDYEVKSVKEKSFTIDLEMLSEFLKELNQEGKLEKIVVYYVWEWLKDE